MKIGSFTFWSLASRRVKPGAKLSIPPSRTIALVVVASLGLMVWAKPMGLLLWARIRILTNIPKTAIADPAVAQSTKPVQPPELDPQLPGAMATLRDPFTVDAEVFPKPVVKLPEGNGARAATEPTRTAQAETDPKETSGAHEGESTAPSVYEALRATAESLRVQSAGAGLTIAIIEDKALRVGETVTAADGTEFTLLKVLDGAVVLGRDEREFVVRMPAQVRSTPSTPAAPTRPQAPKKPGGKP